MLSGVVDEQARAEPTTDLDELFRQGARRMLAAALEAEVEAYLAAHAERDEGGRRLVVRNGHAPARTLATGVARSRWSARGWMTAGSIPPRVSGCSSTA
jgi:hypothetical protein